MFFWASVHFNGSSQVFTHFGPPTFGILFSVMGVMPSPSTCSSGTRRTCLRSPDEREDQETTPVLVNPPSKSVPVHLYADLGFVEMKERDHWMPQYVSMVLLPSGRACFLWTPHTCFAVEAGILPWNEMFFHYWLIRELIKKAEIHCGRNPSANWPD